MHRIRQSQGRFGTAVRAGLFGVLASLCMLASGTSLHAQPASADLPNPFATFESFRLPNGLRVWYGHLPGASTTAMAITVPYGRDQDPVGREQTAHLLEHTLLSDRGGAAEADLARELARRGGTHNAATGPWYTHFLVTIATEEAAYGAGWLHDVVAPRAFDDYLVDRSRSPVAVEISEGTRSFLPPAVARFILHPALRPAGFWRREFGLSVQEERAANQLNSVAAITAADLRRFYDTYYAPSEMTLVIVSGAPRSWLQPVLDSTFATLPWRPPPPVAATPLRMRQEESRSFTWHAGRTTRIAVRYRIAELDGLDHVRLVFIEDLLRHRLMERLRRGEDKLVYGVTASVDVRGPAALLAIRADFAARDEAVVRAAIERELVRLREAVADSAAFYADRDLLSRRLRSENASPAALRHWAIERFHRPDVHHTFPDVGAYYATVGPDSIAAFASRLLAADNRILQVARPLPLSPWLLVLAGVLACVSGARLYRRLTLVPARMDAIRYVARLRPPLAARLLAVSLGTGAVLLAGRLGAAGIHFGSQQWLLRVDSFVVPAAAAALLLLLVTLGAFACVGRVPRKVLVFSDHVRLKSATWRAVIIPAHDIRTASLAHGIGSLPLRRRPVPPVGKGVLLELRDGTGYYLQTRHPAELHAALAGLIAAPLAGSAPSERVEFTPVQPPFVPV